MNLLRDVCCSQCTTTLCNLGFHLIVQVPIGLATLPLQTLIHESGHAFAARILYKNANPKITLNSYGFKGGSCSSNKYNLSKFGKWLGTNNSEAISYAAGPIVDMVTSIALLRFFPGNGYSYIKLLNNVAYAISALSEQAFHTNEVASFDGHDFVGVKIFSGGSVAGALIITSIALGIYGVNSLVLESLSNG